MTEKAFSSFFPSFDKQKGQELTKLRNNRQTADDGEGELVRSLVGIASVRICPTLAIFLLLLLLLLLLLQV